MKKLIVLLIIFGCISFAKPCHAISKCYKDICIGQEVFIIKGLYKNNPIRIIDIIKVGQSDDDAEQVRDYYKYYAHLYDGMLVEVYRDELEIKK
jgi:hypothetical protein